MENAVEALKTAAAVLVFVIAITVAFTMFSKAKVTADTITKSQDEQEYLEVASLDNGILYTSSEAIQGEKISTMTKEGYRIVEYEDVISTIYRYNLEKYGVTIIDSDGNVIVRFDSNTENIMRQWYNIQDGKNSEDEEVTAEQQKKDITDKIKENISNKYVSEADIKLNLEEVYRIRVNGNNSIECGAPWYGNETEIIKRIDADINKTDYKLNRSNI